MKTQQETSSFRRELRQSKKFTKEVRVILLDQIPGCHRVAKPTTAQDRQGADYWAYCQGLRAPLAVDVKIRMEDYRAMRGEDDLALELWSNVERRVIGWTADLTKITDCVLWFWPTTGRYVLMPFRPLRAVFRQNGKRWKTQYKVWQQRSSRASPRRRSRWHSACVIIPRDVVVTAITEWQMKRNGLRMPDNAKLSMALRHLEAAQ